jgi:hypothetical protein
LTFLFQIGYFYQQFHNLMTTALAIFAILSLALCIACLRMAGDPKTWRLLWMDLLGVMEAEIQRDARKAQERQLSWMFMLLFVVLLALSSSCFYWTVVEVFEARRDKTTIEREMEMGQAEVDRMSLRFRR